MTVDDGIRQSCMTIFTQLEGGVFVVCENIMKKQFRRCRQADQHQEEQCGRFPYDLVL